MIIKKYIVKHYCCVRRDYYNLLLPLYIVKPIILPDITLFHNVRPEHFLYELISIMMYIVETLIPSRILEILFHTNIPEKLNID